MRIKAFIMQLCMLCAITIGVVAQSEPAPITASTIANLEQRHTFAGECAPFHPDSTVFATTQGLFDLTSGEALITVEDTTEVTHRLPGFSPDGRWLVIGERIVNVQSGEVVLTIEFPNRQRFMFSDDGLYAHSNGSAFALPDWEPIDTFTLPDYEIFRDTTAVDEFSVITRIGRDFKIGNGVPRYLSPDETYWVVVTGGLSDDIEQGIYDVRTGELLDLPPEFDDPFDAALLLEFGTFTADDTLFFPQSNDGSGEYVGYRLPTFEVAYTLPFDIGDEDRLFVSFSEDRQYFAVVDNGVYLTATGERLFGISGFATFSPDNRWVGTNLGVYQLSDGEQIQTFSDGARFDGFSADGELLTVTPDGVFDLPTGELRFTLAADVGQAFFNADGSLLFGLRAGQVVSIYDTTSGEIATTLEGHGLRLSADERYLSLNVDDSCHVYGVG